MRATGHLLHDTVIWFMHRLVVGLDELCRLMSLELAPALALFLWQFVGHNATLRGQASSLEAALVGVVRISALHSDELRLVSRVTIYVVAVGTLAAAGAGMRDRLQLGSVVHGLDLDRGRDRHGRHLHIAITTSLLLVSGIDSRLVHVSCRLVRASTVLGARCALLDSHRVGCSAALAVLAHHVGVDGILAHG